MKPLRCPGGLGPHQWKTCAEGIKCGRCGLSTRSLGDLRRAQLEAEFEQRRKKAYARRGAIYIPLGEGPAPKIEVVRG